MQPEEFKEMVDAIRNVEATLGKVTYEVSEEDKNRRRSLFVVEDIEAGEVITEKNVRFIRPGVGLHPKYLNEVIGKNAVKNMKRGIPLLVKYVE